MLNLRFIAFVNAEWLTPDEPEPPACSSPAVESIGGILREGGIAICCICLSSYSANMFVFRYLLSISCHILRYTPLVKMENMDFGIVWRLPQLGQGTGMVYTVACHSMSRASKVWPQSSHLNVFFPRNIVRCDF